jgi:L-lysine 6-transaminase
VLREAEVLMKKTTSAGAGRIQPGRIRDTIGRFMLADGSDIVPDLRKSQGCHLVDSVTGRTYLDFFNFFASCPIGVNHPKMTSEESRERLLWPSINKPSNSDFYTVVPKELSSHLFFISGGALAVENALKTAFDWKVRWNQQRGFMGERGYKVIHFEQAFHGRSGYTLSLTNTADPRKTKFFPKFNWPRVPNPKIRFPLDGENLEAVVRDEEKSLSLLRKAIEASPEDIAAIIIEPIQGEGGDNHFRGEFIRELKAIADKWEVFLIFDEIQTGMGATGRWWACEHFDMLPDIIVFGKKTQVCGIAVGKKVDEIENNVFRESSRINSTWGGNLVDMVRCHLYIEIIEEEKLLENAAAVGARFLERLAKLSAGFGDTMTNVRGRGCMIAFDLPTGELRLEVLATMKSNGLLALPCGTRSIRFRPPLNVTEQEVDEAFEIVRASMESTAA